MFGFRNSNRLRREIDDWVRDGIITPDQSRQLYRRYQLSAEAPWYLRSGFFLRAIAVLLGGMGLLLVISRNWNHFPPYVQALVGLFPLVLAYGIGWYLWTREKYENAELAFLFAGIAFGANIYLQAAIFHISAYFPDGLLWWMIGVLPMALFFRSGLHLGLAQILFLIWIGQQSEYGQFSWWALPVYGAIVYLLRLVPGRINLLAAALNLGLLLVNIALVFDGDYYQTGFPLTAAIVLLIMSLLFFFQNQYEAEFLDRVYLLGFLIVLLIFYFHTFEEMIRPYPSATLSLPVLFYGLLSAALFLYHKPSEADGAAAVLVGLLVAVHVAGVWYTGEPGIFAFYGALAANIVFFAVALWSIRYGMKERRKRFFMTGSLMIVALAVGRYLDLFDNYLLTAAVFFACGGFIYGLNTYWDKRYET